MATETIGQELTPTRMLSDWLAETPAVVEDLATKVVVRAWVDSTTDATSEAGEAVTPGERDALRDYLEQRVKKDSGLNRLRADLAKYATLYAPREVSDLGALVAWSLVEVDWGDVEASIAEHPGVPADA